MKRVASGKWQVASGRLQVAGLVLAVLGLLVILGACSGEAPEATMVPPAPTATAGALRPTPTNQPTIQPTTQPTSPPTNQPTSEPTDSIRELTIFYTNDEHGWMEGMDPGRGAANLMALWREAGYTEDGPYLILSGGDMWTGPAISTWFEGESMAEVMNAMGYAAAAVGNHEFDFGLEALGARAFESDFPFLSANIRSDGPDLAELGIQPYTVVDVDGVRVGVIGLTTTSTPVTTNPTNVADFTFTGYEEALRETVPQVRAEGADLIVVAAHICQGELAQLAAQVSDLDIDLMGGGHCNELFATEADGIVLMEGGYHLTSYARATFQVDTETDAVVVADYETVENVPTENPDPAVADVVAKWQAEAEEELSVVIGYLEEPLPRRSEAQQALVVESWLHGYPTADVALTNLGGFRADLPAGEITLADVIGVLPFNNVLVDVELSGQELLRTLAHADAAAGGVHMNLTGRWVLEATGEPIDPDATYHLLVNDFMYAGGDGYEMLAAADPDAYNTAIDWRQPVIDWIMAQESSVDNPLDDEVEALLD